MNESKGNNLEKSSLTLEQNELVSGLTKDMGDILDIYMSGEYERMLSKANQIINETADPVRKKILKNFSELLDAGSNTEGGDERVLRRAINLSRID